VPILFVFSADNFSMLLLLLYDFETFRIESATFCASPKTATLLGLSFAIAVLAAINY